MSEAGHAETDTQANVQVPNDYLLRFACFVAWRAEIEVAIRGSRDAGRTWPRTTTRHLA